MPLKGLDYKGAKNPLERTGFRTSWTQPEGAESAFIHEARVIDINLANWTVDCITIFDQKRFFDIQVASPYMHSNSGEGIYVVPEVGAKCLVCIPSDGPPPFVLAFIMPAETVTDTTPDKDDTKQLSPGTPTGSTYAGGRTRPKPGDIVMKGRDGNFCILHRGGVLQIGSTELAQRIFIPLGNLVTDISQNYNHFNTGGSVNWGIRPGSPDEDPETEYRHTFRVFANDEFADIRMALGSVHTPTQEPTGDAGGTSDINALGIGTDKNNPIVCELSLAPGGFDTHAGLPQKNIRDLSKLRFFFDRAGGAFLRFEGALAFRVKRKLRLRVDDNIDIIGKKNLTIDVDGTGTLRAGSLLELTTDGGVVKLNGGSKPVATVGSIVRITIIAPVPILTPVGQGTILTGAVFTGIVSTGNPTVLA